MDLTKYSRQGHSKSNIQEEMEKKQEQIRQVDLEIQVLIHRRGQLADELAAMKLQEEMWQDTSAAVNVDKSTIVTTASVEVARTGSCSPQAVGRIF